LLVAFGDRPGTDELPAQQRATVGIQPYVSSAGAQPPEGERREICSTR